MQIRALHCTETKWLAAGALSTTVAQPPLLLHYCQSGMIDKVFLSVGKRNVQCKIVLLSLFEQSNISQFWSVKHCSRMADTFSLQNMNKTAFYSEILLNFTQRYSFFSLQITFQKCTFAFETANLQIAKADTKGQKRRHIWLILWVRIGHGSAAKGRSTFQIHRWGTWRKIMVIIINHQ